jgi:cytoskeletal protein CcmA (bactofilin family)
MGFLSKKPDEIPQIKPAAAQQPLPARPAGPGRKGSSTLSPDLQFNGEIRGNDDLIVEGTLEGQIDIKGQVTVNPSGVVRAELRARRVFISGKVFGNVAGEESVELHPSGHLEGNIQSPKVIIHEGAQFKGSVDMKFKETAAPPSTPKP